MPLLDDEIRSALTGFTRAATPTPPIASELDSVRRRGRRVRRRRALLPAAATIGLALILLFAARLPHETSLGTTGGTGDTTVSSTTLESRPTTTETTMSPSTTTSSPSSTSLPSTTASTTATSTPQTTPRPSSEPSTAAGAVPVDLVFTGRYAGHVTTATLAGSGLIVGPHDGNPSAPPACTNYWPKEPDSAVIGIQGTLGSQPFILGYDGATTDMDHSLAEGVLLIGHDPPSYSDAIDFDPKTLVFDADLLGAGIDSDLFQHMNANDTIVGHVKGHFRCAP